MWRKQDDPKASSPQTNLVVQSASEQTRSPLAPAQESESVGTSLGPGISVKGDITGREDLFIDGEVQGTIHIEDGKVTVGPKGHVTADIEAREIIIHGKVKGLLRGRERVRIARGGQATGEVITRRIVIEEGAVYRGKVDTVGAEQAQAPRPMGVATGTEALRPVPVPAKYSQL